MATAENDPVLIALMRRSQDPSQQDVESDSSDDSGDDTLAAVGQDLIDAVRRGDPAAVGSAIQTAVEAILGRTR